jgi:hypothetical protein
MMNYVTMSLSMMIATLMTTAALAGSMPDYKCAEQNTRCEKACDEMAEGSQNANAYQRCLDRCLEANQSCVERQARTTGCAKAFIACTKQAAGNANAQEGCREAYRHCKGN